MTASFALVAASVCAQVEQSTESTAANSRQNAAKEAETAQSPRAAASLITDVTVYQGQALVIREVTVPAGEGTVELVVTPLPAQTVDSSLYTESAEGLRVLSTRFRTRAVEDDTRREVRAKEELIKNSRLTPSDSRSRSPSNRRISDTSRNSGVSQERR